MWFTSVACSQQTPPAWLYQGTASPLILTVVAQRLVKGYPGTGPDGFTIDPNAPKNATQSNGVSYTAFKSAFKTYRIGNREILQTLQSGGIIPGKSISGWRLIVVHTKWGRCAPYAIHKGLDPIPVGTWLKLEAVETQIARVGRDQVTSLSSSNPTPHPRTGGFLQTNLSDVNLTFALPEPLAETTTFRFGASGYFTEAFHYDADKYVGGYFYPSPLALRHTYSGPLTGNLWLDHPDPRFSEKMFAQITLTLGPPDSIPDLRTRYADLLRLDLPPWHQLAHDPIP